MPSKYRNVRTVYDGINFHSQAEARRYAELRLLEKAGEVTRLQLQPKFALVVNDVKIGTAIADFRYEQRDADGVWRERVEDVKGGPSTAVFRLKSKLVKALYGVDVIEFRHQR